MIKQLRWYIVATAVIVLIVVFAIFQSSQDTSTEQKKSSSYAITDKESDAIIARSSRFITACGTWGVDLHKVTASNASAFYDSGRSYALNVDRLPGEFDGWATSRADQRTVCLNDYVAPESTMQEQSITYSDKDTVMSYSVDSSAITVSKPEKITINQNDKPSVTIAASWTSKESGLYPVFKAVEYDDGGYEYNNVINGDTLWKSWSVNHRMSNIDISMQKDGDRWDIVGISGGNWKTEGYVNAVSSIVALQDGAARIQTPWEQYPDPNYR